MTGMSTRRCDRTRALLSQRLDRVLTEIEDRAVARHVAGCTGCRAFAEQVAWLTETLRAAPLEDAARPVVVSPVRTGRVSLRVVGRVASVAATVVVTVGAWAIGTAANTEAPGEPVAPRGVVPGTVLDDGLRAIKVEALRAGELPILPPAPPTYGMKPARSVDDP